MIGKNYKVLPVRQAQEIQRVVENIQNLWKNIVSAISGFINEIVHFFYKCLRCVNPHAYSLMHHKKKRISKKNRHRLLRKFYRLQAMVKT